MFRTTLPIRDKVITTSTTRLLKAAPFRIPRSMQKRQELIKELESQYAILKEENLKLRLEYHELQNRYQQHLTTLNKIQNNNTGDTPKRYYSSSAILFNKANPATQSQSFNHDTHKGAKPRR